MQIYNQIYLENDEFPYLIVFPSDGVVKIHEILEWCQKSFGQTGENWITQWYGIRFKEEQYASWFLLRYCGCDQ